MYPSPAPRPRFADGNQSTDAERAASFTTFIAGAGAYTFDETQSRVARRLQEEP